VTSRSGSGPTKPRGYQRRERLIARWRFSTVLAAVVALVAVGAVLAAALSLGGFGIPTDATPQAISPGDVPFGLLGHESPSTATTAPPHNSAPPQFLYFINSLGQLRPAVVNLGIHVSIASILNALMNGPTSGNLETEIPPGTQVLSARVSAGLVTVNLTSGIESASGESLIQAFAQIVFTATPVACPANVKKSKSKNPSKLPPTTTTSEPKQNTTLPCTNRVLFEEDGLPLQVPLVTGAQTSRPITRADYSSLSS
jgi:hypothetical protein